MLTTIRGRPCLRQEDSKQHRDRNEGHHKKELGDPHKVPLAAERDNHRWQRFSPVSQPRGQKPKLVFFRQLILGEGVQVRRFAHLILGRDRDADVPQPHGAKREDHRQDGSDNGCQYQAVRPVPAASTVVSFPAFTNATTAARTTPLAVAVVCAFASSATKVL